MYSYFDEIEEIGGLIVEKILFGGPYPVYFTGRNKEKELFLCCRSRFGKDKKIWLVARVTPEIVIQVLQDELTLREPFTIDGYYTISHENGKYVLTGDDNYLPTEGAFMEAEEDEFKGEIEFYRGLINK